MSSFAAPKGLRKVSMSASSTESSKQAGGYEYPFSYDTCEIEEENCSSGNELFEIMPMGPIKEEIESSFFSFDVNCTGRDHNSQQDIIYVAVGKSESSMDALSWTLRHAVNPSTLIYLIHVFPQVKFIPSPLGKLPRNQVNPAQLETFMAQERGKRRELLQKFLNACSNCKIEADTMLIESDLVAKAILDLIPILNIRKLVVGTTKSSLRKFKSKRGSGMADQILQSAPETCEIKIVCEGKEVMDQIINDSPSPPPPPQNNAHNSPKPSQESDDSFSCMCFKI